MPSLPIPEQCRGVNCSTNAPQYRQDALLSQPGLWGADAASGHRFLYRLVVYQV